MKAQLEPMTFSGAAGAAGHGSAEAAQFSTEMLSSTSGGMIKFQR